MRLQLFLSMIFLFCVCSLPGQAQEATEASLQAWECPKGFSGKTLDIMGWFTYNDEAILENFERACGVTINYTGYDDEYFALDTVRLGNPGYDLFYVSGTIVQLMHKENLAIPLDMSLITNVVNIDPNFLNLNYDPDNTVSLPYFWGSVGVGYKKEIFPDGINFWNDVWNHTGQVVWIDDYRAMLGIALQLLGYNPNSSNADEIYAARDYLGEHGTNLMSIFSGSVHPLYEAGEADIVIAYSNNSARWILNCGCNTYGFAIPAEGSNIYVDNLLIPVDADEVELAMTFINYSLEPTVSAEFSSRGAAGPTNARAFELGLINERLLNEQGFNPSDEIFSRMFFINPLEESVATFYEVAWGDLLLFYGSE